MTKQFKFEITGCDKTSLARTGVIHTPHGDIETPAYIPVGTQCSVKSLTPDDLDILGTQIFFVNTYHAFLRPGLDIIKKFGGLHAFMNWHHPLITDSGGFQIFSLGSKRIGRSGQDPKSQTSLVKISDDGVIFKSHWDGSEHIFTPELSMQHQWGLGADIHIIFDDCTPYPVTRKQALISLDRTHKWAQRSLTEHQKLMDISCQTSAVRRQKYLLQAESYSSKANYQALYGSIQGSIYQDLRVESAKYMAALSFDGLAIGGVSVGETKTEMIHVLDWVTPYLPAGLPRHLLGVGQIDDIFNLVMSGIDTFDCVEPTRLARMGYLFHRLNSGDRKLTEIKYTIDINQPIYASDQSPIEATCNCYTCRNFSRAYIHHLFKVRELLSYRLATIHNIFFINTLMSLIKIAIKNGSLLELKKLYI